MTSYKALAPQYRAALEARGFVLTAERATAPAGLSRREAQRLKQAAWHEALRGAAYTALVLKGCGCCHEHVFAFSAERAERVRAQAEAMHAVGVAVRAM